MKVFFIIYFLSCSFLAMGQVKLGNEWITGGGGQKIVFDGNNITTSNAIFYSTYFSKGNSNICDTSGNLILCSDGYNIYDKNANFVEDGDTLVALSFYVHEDGWSNYAQSSIFLPVDSEKYYFVTPTYSDLRFADCLTNFNCNFDLLLYNVVDMKANAGAGKVIQRMVPLMENAELSKTQTMACRHSNGKDWWLLKQGVDSNIIYKFLFKQDTVENKGVQKFDSPVWGISNRFGQSMFSQDGSKYVTITEGGDAIGKIFIADFDRCYGVLSNPKEIQAPISNNHSPLPPPWDSSSNLDESFVGVAFSPDGSKLFVTSMYNIFQFDLVDETWYHVAGLDTSWQKFQAYSNCYLGPDDKLYIGNWAGLSTQMSVINNPDAKGANCNFCPRCLRMDTLAGTYTGTPPCMPNYSLGAQFCGPESINNIVSNNDFVVFPNPANTVLHIEMQIASQSLAITAIKKELFNSIGQLLFTTCENEIDISGYSRGVYYIKVGNVVRKIVIE